MRPADFGPVPVSRLKADAAGIYRALEQGRKVLVSRRGEVVAVVDPAEAVPTKLLVEYVLPGRRHLGELTATEINQGSPSRAVANASHGVRSYFSKDHRVYGVLREVTADELAEELPSDEEVAARQRRIDDYLRNHPQAGASELAALSAAGGEAEDETKRRELEQEVNDLAKTVDRLAEAVAVPAHRAVAAGQAHGATAVDGWQVVAKIATEAAALAEAVVRSTAGISMAARSK